MGEPFNPANVPKKKLYAEPPASTNIRQDDTAHQNQRKHIEEYIQLKQKLLDDFFEKTFLQRTNSSDPTACLEECTIKCVATLVLMGRAQHVKGQYELRLTSGKLPIIKKLPITPPCEDQTMTDAHTTNDAKEATRPGLARDESTTLEKPSQEHLSGSGESHSSFGKKTPEATKGKRGKDLQPGEGSK